MKLKKKNFNNFEQKCKEAIKKFIRKFWNIVKNSTKFLTKLSQFEKFL